MRGSLQSFGLATPHDGWLQLGDRNEAQHGLEAYVNEYHSGSLSTLYYNSMYRRNYEEQMDDAVERYPFNKSTQHVLSKCMEVKDQ